MNPVSNDLGQCTSYCSAAFYDLKALQFFFKKKSYQTWLLKDVLHVSNKKNGDVFFFSYGAMVSWGYKKHAEEKFLEYALPFSDQPLLKREVDQFSFCYGDETKIEAKEGHLDLISLSEEEVNLKLAISQALAQSVKLESFEEIIQDAVKQNAFLPDDMAEKGRIRLNRRAIFRRVGEIFKVRNSINLSSEYLDTPEFFWRNPLLEPYYDITKKFLDIPSRVAALNQKLDVLQEMLYILNSQAQHIHSSLLEVVIIVLISAEIVINLMQWIVLR